MAILLGAPGVLKHVELIGAPGVLKHVELIEFQHMEPLPTQCCITRCTPIDSRNDARQIC